MTHNTSELTEKELFRLLEQAIELARQSHANNVAHRQLAKSLARDLLSRRRIGRGVISALLLSPYKAANNEQ